MQKQKQKRIPFGNDKQKGKGKSRDKADSSAALRNDKRVGEMREMDG
jgi:hypothetical protein